MGKVKKLSNLPKLLTPRQIGILEDLEDLLERPKEYEGRTPEEMQQLSLETRDRFILLQNDYHEVVLKAIRARVDRHPLVEEKVKNLLIDWVRNRQALGQWDLLRRAKPRRIEVGVKRPLAFEKAKLLVNYEELREREEEGIKDMGKLLVEAGNPRVLEKILQVVRESQKFDPNMPIRKRRRFKTEAHRILVKKGVNKTARQVLLKKIKRYDPKVD